MEPLTYAAAGVDVEAGDRAVQLMKAAVARTHGPEVLTGVGGFAGLFDLSAIKERQRWTWASGDYSAIAARIVPMAERLVESAGLLADDAVLDVATGTGNAASVAPIIAAPAITLMGLLVLIVPPRSELSPDHRTLGGCRPCRHSGNTRSDFWTVQARICRRVPKTVGPLSVFARSGRQQSPVQRSTGRILLHGGAFRTISASRNAITRPLARPIRTPVARPARMMAASGRPACRQ